MSEFDFDVITDPPARRAPSRLIDPLPLTAPPRERRPAAPTPPPPTQPE